MPLSLIKINHKLSLQQTGQHAPGPVCVDFLSGKSTYRHHHGGGKNQLIAKAVGITSKIKPFVLDATAGLGQDAFVLATLGCNVLMLERSKIICALLEDGLNRAKNETWFRALSLKLVCADAINYLKTISSAPDVIYLDPMFPEKTNSALPKKEMRLLREVAGDDIDSEKLFFEAVRVAKKRIVVKRARLAPTISAQKPDLVFTGKSGRFDIYFPSKINRAAFSAALVTDQGSPCLNY
ncbi:MAG: hypothetical protein A3I77_06470 [Gammaproteobacteria bacterium RIFCSPLOWO2_02_FULL_42_14]|nr:MAG: hypothetical protein A3B71_06370 [Gammaproteobacteria bacterium RIFCSPHIGHO2_02_FULL_42_43]OGT29088.1 MAG: hypothetical protein A2624_05220 [Gammaproteobacteria bacterium RIFCSPHIGHO2_01_FULL_42_8]OGT52749.1 MAG: hypothetical protein A3E54_02550 [Gammaproteobacteria bacterium RIFCSPHIGHO2_12_FULL_41_25]OGT63289.1 MAG: hypothetical protein A3I77_06470 [Gammaproteobacteria bacterium RIFCSPLOWO2_02_FULL_42_14]OGT86877.1 MAG: hypothetical protein A3G86_05730 [Gammaproteobacteria bacterium R